MAQLFVHVSLRAGLLGGLVVHRDTPKMSGRSPRFIEDGISEKKEDSVDSS